METMLSAQELEDYMGEVFPQVNSGGKFYSVEAVTNGIARLKFEPGEQHLRPGNTVSGPALFALSDYAAYVVLLAHIGKVPLAVTTNLNIDFLNKPDASAPIYADAEILKLGKRLAVISIKVVSSATNKMVAHATATYSMPPRD